MFNFSQNSGLTVYTPASRSLGAISGQLCKEPCFREEAARFPELLPNAELS